MKEHDHIGRTYVVAMVMFFCVILGGLCIFRPFALDKEVQAQITNAEERNARVDHTPTEAEMREWRETQWSAWLSQKFRGTAEHRLPDGSRIDILTSDVAWEVEWAYKWPEAIGQSVYYGMATGRKPGVCLLVKSGDDEDYLRCLMVCRKLDIVLSIQHVK